MFVSRFLRSSTRKTKDVVVAAAVPPTQGKQPHRPKLNFDTYVATSIELPDKVVDSVHFHSMYNSDLKYQLSLRTYTQLKYHSVSKMVRQNIPPENRAPDGENKVTTNSDDHNGMKTQKLMSASRSDSELSSGEA